MEVKPMNTPHRVHILSSRDYHRPRTNSDGKIEFELGTKAAFNALFVVGWYVVSITGSKLIMGIK